MSEQLCKHGSDLCEWCHPVADVPQGREPVCCVSETTPLPDICLCGSKDGLHDDKCPVIEHRTLETEAVAAPKVERRYSDMMHEFIACANPDCTDKEEHCELQWCGAPRDHPNHLRFNVEAKVAAWKARNEPELPCMHCGKLLVNHQEGYVIGGGIEPHWCCSPPLEYVAAPHRNDCEPIPEDLRNDYWQICQKRNLDETHDYMAQLIERIARVEAENERLRRERDEAREKEK